MTDDYTAYALVADDDVMIRLDASDILQDAGFKVHEAGGVEEAIDILKRTGASIQLLFSDVQMPPGELNGFDLARKCAEGWPHIKILVASGQISPNPGDMPDGAVFIGKPFTHEVVHELLPDGLKPERLKVGRVQS